MINLRLSEIRTDKGLTQADLALHLKITQQAYSSYETGKREMNFETLCMIANFYGVTTDYLLGRQEKIPSFLNEEERDIIDKYRELDERGKDSIKNNLSFEYSNSKKIKSIKKSAI